MSVPRRFVGAWERETLHIAGVPIPEIGRAVWIESGGIYVDVRAPGAVASGTGFGGRCSWRAPRFTWHHDVDLHPRPGTVDRGELTLDEDRVIERGTGIDGSAAPYEERWRRVHATETGITAVAIHEHGLAVRVGDRAAVVSVTPALEASCARLWDCTAGAWVEAVTLGAPGDTPRPADTGWWLPPGWSLHSS